MKAEKRQLKAEVKEIRKQLRMERRSLQWGCAGDGNSSPVLLQPRATQANSPECVILTIISDSTVLFVTCSVIKLKPTVRCNAVNVLQAVKPIFTAVRVINIFITNKQTVNNIIKCNIVKSNLSKIALVRCMFLNYKPEIIISKSAHLD